MERREWSDGYALFTWDLTPDGSGSPVHLHPNYRGQVTITGGIHARDGHTRDVDRLR